MNGFKHKFCLNTDLFIGDANFTLPDLWKSPRGGFGLVVTEFADKNHKFLQPGSTNRGKKYKTTNIVITRHH